MLDPLKCYSGQGLCPGVALGGCHWAWYTVAAVQLAAEWVMCANKICCEPRADASRLGVGESSGELVGLALG